MRTPRRLTTVGRNQKGLNEMNIAVIGWGSLIWCPGSLLIKSRWRSDGPMLPIEFARISGDGRLTLVVHSGAQDVQTYWALSALDSLGEARDNLRKREGAAKSSIGFVRANDDNPTPFPGTDELRKWLGDRHDLDGAIWTALDSNWRERRGRDFTAGDAIDHLSELERQRDEASLIYNKACEYIRNAPGAIRTEVRAILDGKADFKSAELARVLFEPEEESGAHTDTDSASFKPQAYSHYGLSRPRCRGCGGVRQDRGLNASAAIR